MEEMKRSVEEKALDVSFRMLKFRLKHDWLINLFAQDGITLARTELSDILHGRRKSKKAEEIIDGAIRYLDKYEKVFVQEGV